MLITKNSGYEISDMRLMSDGVGNTLATSGEDGDVAVSSSDLKRIVSGGTVVGEVNFNAPWAVHATQDGGTYWFIKDGKMTTNYVFNSVLGQDPQTVIPTLFTEVKEVTNDGGGVWTNGKVYEYESDFGVFGKLDGLEYTSLKTMLTSIGETKYPNFVFAYLMRQAEIFATIDGVLAWDYRLAGRLIGFIPTNEALKEALDNDRIPGVKGTIDLSLPSPTLQGEVTNKRLLGEYLLNSILTTAMALVILLVVSLPAAYVLARYNFKGRRFFNTLFMAGLFINVNYIVVPIFLMLLDWDDFIYELLGGNFFLNNIFVLAVVYAATAIPFTVYLLSGYFKTLPKAYEEAALIDGCGYYKTMVRVMIPMAKPSIITVILFNFLAFWNEYIIALTLLPSTSKTLPVGLLNLMQATRGKAEYGMMYAGLVVVMLPTLILYIIVQKKLTQGMTLGGLKD